MHPVLLTHQLSAHISVASIVFTLPQYLCNLHMMCNEGEATFSESVGNNTDSGIVLVIRSLSEEIWIFFRSFCIRIAVTSCQIQLKFSYISKIFEIECR